MSPKTKQNLIITIIAVVMAIVLAVSIVIATRPVEDGNKVITDDDSKPTSTSSNLKFELVDEETSTYPQTATNWSKYGYSEPTSTIQGYTEITTSENTVMGVVDVDKWEKVSGDLSFTVANPGKHDDSATDSNVYMIHNINETTASIYSKSYTVASKTYYKITLWINSANIESGKAFVMVKKGLSSALESNWYAYDFDIEQADGWQQKELYLFNQSSTSSTVYINVGLGNVYSGETAKGTLFVDDIVYEKLTANDYRIHAKDTAKTTHVIPATEEDKVLDTKEFVQYENTAFTTMSATEYVDETKTYVENQNGCSPFAEEVTINKFSGEDVSAKTGLKIDLGTIEKSATENDILYLGFWVRVAQSNVYSSANVYLVDSENKSIGYDYTAIITSQEIETDNLCGWQEYKYYIKPDELPKQLTLLVTLGDKDGYNQTEKYLPSATVYVTNPEYELISETAYDEAISGSYAKKVELSVTGASFGVTNGSFSEQVTVGQQPMNWTPVFAGDAEIFKNGGTTISGLNTKASAILGSGIENNAEIAPAIDDANHKYLKVNNAETTAFGYVSQQITLSANTVYAISVLAKGDGTATPSMYVVSGSEVIASLTASATDSSEDVDAKFFQTTAGNGWTRYYFVLAIGDNDKNVTIALFNGAIDGKTTQSGAVYFDQVDYVTIGSYTRDEDDAKVVEFTAEGKLPLFDELEEANVLKKVDFTSDIVEEPETSEEEPEETPTNNTTNWALLISIISSSFLVAALLIVIVVKAFRKH